MKNIWKVKSPPDPAKVKSLSSAINVNASLATILVQRGIDDFEKAKAFFRPNLSDLHDPFLMKDMDLAVERILKAKANGEQVLVYGDYDVDGTTSVAFVRSFLEDIGMNVSHYIPDRYQEGYGVSYQGIDFADDNGFTLIVALDCGIKANDKVDYANKKNIDFIICDHHRPGEKLPAAVAVLDPKREDCSYPYKELCGCGVGFKLMQALSERAEIENETLYNYLDLVAIAIGADIVPITGENRTLSYFGLKRVNRTPRLGLKILLDKAQVQKQLTITDLVFIIAPRINAAGRIESGNRAVELLIGNDQKATEELADRINKLNVTRRTLDKDITDSALTMIQEDEVLANSSSTVLYNEGWHKGVVGIVASRLIEKHYKPTIVLTEADGLLTGSARSVKNFDVYNAIDSCRDLLENFGGHMYAAGLTMKKENISEFKKRFEKYVVSNIKEESLQPEIIIDQEINLIQITKTYFAILKQIGPFGPQNMKPVFVAKNCFNAGNSKLLKEKHIKFDVYQNDDKDHRFNGIGFGMPEHIDLVCSKEPFDIVFSIDENHWNGNVNLQLMVKDVRAILQEK